MESGCLAGVTGRRPCRDEFDGAGRVYKTLEFDSFVGLPAEWRAFVDASASTFDQTPEWFDLFERFLLSRDERLAAIGVRDEKSALPVLLLPLRTARIPILGPVALRGIAAVSNYYTGLFGPISGENARSDVPAIVAAELAARHGLIDFNPIAVDCEFWPLLQDALLARGYRAQRYFRFGNWFLDVGGRSSIEYQASLPGRVRSTITRKGRRLAARADVEISIVVDPERVDHAMDCYERVYSSSWKVAEPHLDFIRAFARAAAQRGWLRLGLVEVGKVPVAAQLWFVYRGTASIFKLAYDEEFADLSVGTILTWTLMQRVIDLDRVQVVDYLCGDDDYKQEWMSSRRERQGLRLVRSRSIAGLTAATVRVAGIVRSRAKQKPAVRS